MRNDHPIARSLLLSLAVAVCCRIPSLAAQPAEVHATIDVSRTGAPISGNLYGQFLEHGGNIVNANVWAEMLEDRKFYNPVTSTPPPAPVTPGGRRLAPLRYWAPVGEAGAVIMDPKSPYTGDHSPRITLSTSTRNGISQTGLAVRKGRSYTGRLVLAGTPGTVVRVTLTWGAAPSSGQTVTLRKITSAYETFPIHFLSGTDTENATLEITGTGTGSFHIGAVSLMPADNIQGFRPEVIDALKQLHSGVYRFPGGNFVSAYEWRDAVGDMDKRPPIYDPVWHAVQPNDVGTDEFLTLCRLLGVAPYITVNAGFGDAWSARELVEYTNGATTTPMGKWRAANGHPQPYDVKLWGIGNEPWGDYQMGAMSVEQYVIKHNQFAKAMRKVDPSITLIAGGAMPDVMTGANQSKRISGKFVPDLLSDADWSGYMLSHTLQNIDMLSEHYYASDMHTDLTLEKKVPIGPQPLIEWERAAATQVRVKYEYYQDYLRLIPALRAKPVPIAIDEWAYIGAPRNSYKVVPAYAWAFHEMFRHSEVFQLAAFTFATAMMDETRTDAVLNPTGLMFKMYSDHFGKIPVAVSGDSPQPKPRFPAGGDQPSVNPGSDTYPLDVSAALSDDHKTLAIAVLNPSDAVHSIHLDFAGATLARDGHLWQMAPASVDAVVEVGKKAEVSVEDKTLGAMPDVLQIPPFSVNIYSYRVQ